METQTIRACWHTHAPLPPLFDWGNKRYIWLIDKYLDNLKKGGINAIALTTHNYLNIKNHKLDKRGEISFARGNINPKTIFEIFQKRAKKKGIIVFPALEVEVYPHFQNPDETIHLGVVHHDPEKIYNHWFYRDHFLEEVLENIPPGSVVDIKHPWSPKHGAAHYVSLRELRRLIKKYHLLVEKHGWAIISLWLINRACEIFPPLKKIGSLKMFYLATKHSIGPYGFEDCIHTVGSDAHSIAFLPRGGGYIQLKFPPSSKITKESILQAINKGKGKAILPQKINFLKGCWLFIKLFLSLRIETLILYKVKSRKEQLKNKIFKELLSNKPSYKKIKIWLDMNNEGMQINDVLSEDELQQIRKLKSGNRFKLGIIKLNKKKLLLPITLPVLTIIFILELIFCSYLILFPTAILVLGIILFLIISVFFFLLLSPYYIYKKLRK